MKHSFSGPAAIAAGALLVLVLAGCSDRSPGPPQTALTTSVAQETASSASPTAVPTTVPASTQPGREMTVAELVQLAEPAVVRIQTSGGVGSGFLVSTDGYIVTNNHVVQDRIGSTAANVSVTLSDGATVSGVVVGTDPRSDLALVKIDGGPYRALQLGRLADVQIGQDVVAIGYALDLARGEGPSFTVTRGIVSQKNRAISESAPILGAIQTDAAINHGNSGGPLLTLTGLVIGVNTALAPDPNSPSGVAQGIGFAVGVDTVRAVWEQLRDHGRVNRGLLGIQQFQALRPAQARTLGIPENVGGVYLSSPDSVAPGGPAALAGIRSGDVITRIGDLEIANEADLAVAMILNGPGTVVEVEVYRGPQRLTFDVTLGTP